MRQAILPSKVQKRMGRGAGHTARPRVANGNRREALGAEPRDKLAKDWVTLVERERVDRSSLERFARRRLRDLHTKAISPGGV